MAQKNNWAIIRFSGRVENLGTEHSSFWDILAIIHTEMSSAGGNHDQPQSIFLNGKAIHLPKTPFSFAWAYFNKLREEHGKVTKTIREQFLADIPEEVFNGTEFGN